MKLSLHGVVFHWKADGDIPKILVFPKLMIWQFSIDRLQVFKIQFLGSSHLRIFVQTSLQQADLFSVYVHVDVVIDVNSNAFSFRFYLSSYDL